MAYELAALMTFEKHEELIDTLFLEYQREPLSGFHAVSVDQLQAADREVHVRMAELTRSGLVPGADGTLPLDGPVTTVLASSQIQWMLMPRPKGSGSGHGGAVATGNPEKPGKPPKKPPPKKVDPTKASDKDQKADPPGPPNAGGKGGKQRKTRFVMPRAVIGGVPRDDSGNNICFDHNLGKCTNAAGACPKGAHVCCYPSCFDASHVFSYHKAS